MNYAYYPASPRATEYYREMYGCVDDDVESLGHHGVALMSDELMLLPSTDTRGTSVPVVNARTFGTRFIVNHHGIVRNAIANDPVFAQEHRYAYAPMKLESQELEAKIGRALVRSVRQYDEDLLIKTTFAAAVAPDEIGAMPMARHSDELFRGRYDTYYLLGAAGQTRLTRALATVACGVRVSPQPLIRGIEVPTAIVPFVGIAESLEEYGPSVVKKWLHSVNQVD